MHLSPLQLVLMGTAMEATIFLCVVPAGVVADTFSRRLPRGLVWRDRSCAAL